jgi:ribosomal protein L17
VIISTWSAGFYDVTAINDLIESGDVTDFKIILDRSFKTRQAGYSAIVTDLFKPENIRTTNTHSKFVLIYNDEWTVCIRSSMNLNENKRCENFDVDNDKAIFDLFKTFSDDLFKSQQPGIIEDRKQVDPIFDSLFSNEGGATNTKEKSFGVLEGW